jgi:myo-inositol-1-phosphate synthase
VENNGKIKVAIIGVGNCASSLVQGVEFSKNAGDGEHVPGLRKVVVSEPVSTGADD